ncbi:DUF1177 domain-containing protein [Brevibacterium sp.]|uniref:DUF1177 domain-containing protein n=1 Tax=Brevibacterium sp. TaxID=1701 RepID=UPI0028119F2D|nr:DUF1177 domain-containing protein [Brevibacterium sp.]
MLSHVLSVLDLLDSPQASAAGVIEALEASAPDFVEFESEVVTGEKGSTDFIRIIIPGTEGKRFGGRARTLGILGRLGGLGARPELIGFVSDGDGAAAALSAAAKLCAMAAQGDRLVGDVIVATHIDPDAPTQPHDPVPFMNSVVEIEEMNAHEVSSEMDAIVSIDTTKGNRLLNHRGISITPTAKDGYLLRVSEDLIGVLETVTGDHARVFPITQQDITPYGNGLHHVNSIMQPAVATDAPVVGVALTTVTAVAGCATGASHAVDIEAATRFAIEVAKGFGSGAVDFFDEVEFERIVDLYGSNSHFRRQGGAGTLCSSCGGRIADEVRATR